MGAACCVAAKDKTIQSGSSGEILPRNIRCSPTWSFRWDHRGRVAGEDTSINWFSDISRNDRLENKNESSYVSEDGSPLQNYQRNRWKKSEGIAGLVINSSSDPSISRNVSMDVSMEQVKELAEPSAVSCPSPAKPSCSLPSTSLLVSPLPSQSHLPTSSSTPLRWPCHSSGHQLLRQVSDSRIMGFKSPSNCNVSEERPGFPSWSNESGMRSHGESSDNWSRSGFSELMGTSRMDRWSFDSEPFGFNCERLVRSSSRFSTSPVDLQTCGVCSRLLTEKSSWSTQKIIANNDLSVVSVLICGHVYHAECLESVTPEINKYDPACPVCTFGEKQTLKLFENALKAVRATIRETPTSTMSKWRSPSPSLQPQKLGAFSFTATTPKKDLEKRTVSPHRFPLLRAGSMSCRRTSRPTTPNSSSRATTPSPSNARLRCPSEPFKSASMRLPAEREHSKDIEQHPTKSKRLLKALLSRRKSKKDDMLYTYLDEY